MKRVRFESEIDSLVMADCLISSSKSKTESFRRRVFVCKTCNREFSSFQALGGHRASHRKPKFSSDTSQNNAIKSKPHECSICGVEFPVGQALGGHMRRHRNSSPVPVSLTPAQPVSDDSDCDSGNGVVGMDLNLTPLENDLVRLQLMAPPVGCFT